MIVNYKKGNIYVEYQLGNVEIENENTMNNKLFFYKNKKYNLNIEIYHRNIYKDSYIKSYISFSCRNKMYIN